MPWGAAISALAPIALGILGATGQSRTNRENREQAQKQMDFQERMSSTAAQRSVEDYRKAGLNPALAYDRTASSPGGASAQMGDVIGAGISNAQQARALRQQMSIAADQNKADIALKKSAEQANVTSAELAHQNSIKTWQEITFAAMNQPADLRMRLADAAMKEYLLPGAKNTADFENMVGKYGKGVGSAKTAAEIIKMFFPRRY